MVWMIVVALLVVAALVLAYLSALPAEYQVSRTRLFDQSQQQLFDKIRDFRSWPAWSPWLIHEPDTHLEYSDNCDQQGGYYSWDGRLIGAGRLTHSRFDEPRRIEQQIEFTRPFKSVCQVSFEFRDREGQTELCWSMQGRMPLLFRFMTARTVAMIEKDYDLGLAMLAGHLDSSVAHPRLVFNGATQLQPQQCLCQPFQGDLQAMIATMEAAFPRLVDYVQQHGELSAPPRVAYHRVDMEKMYFVCDMAAPLAAEIAPGEYQLKTLDGGVYYQVTLTGDYQFLELAWYSAMAHVQMLKLKPDSHRPSLEVYENDPRQLTDSNDWITSLYIPIKG